MNKLALIFTLCLTAVDSHAQTDFIRTFRISKYMIHGETVKEGGLTTHGGIIINEHTKMLVIKYLIYVLIINYTNIFQ